jgi:hypothetical protein
MARTTLPDPLVRRHLIERALDGAQALRIAEAYLAEERLVEAVDFLRKAGAGDRLAALRAQAIETGDVFLLRAVAAAAGERPAKAEWLAVAAAAAAAGKPRYASEARRQAEAGEE